MILQICLALTLVLCLIDFYFRYNRAGRLMGIIPGPKILPLIGNALELSLNPELMFKFNRRCVDNYGGSVCRLIALNQRAINIYEPEDIEVVLSSASSKFHEKPILYKFLRAWLGEGLLTSSETSMGISNITEIGSRSNKYFKALQTLANCIIYRTSKVFYYSDLMFNLSETSRVQKKALEYLHRFTDDVIKNRRKCRVLTDDKSESGVYGKTRKMAMLDVLLEQEDKGNIDAQSIREEVDTFIFEGHDTTSSTLRFMLMRIANETIIQGRICEELKSIFGDSDRAATMDDLNEMKYLERCIKEALRLYPGVPYVGRMLREETVLNGYTIPADTICSIHIFQIHRLEKLFPNPEVFDPDRFLPENVAQRHPYAYIPFSAGPRNCIGQKFAMLEMKTVVSGILRRFHLEPVTRPEDIVFVSDLVLQAKHPMYVRFIERNVQR